MGDSDFRPPGAPKPLNRSSWNLAWLITSSPRPHMPKLIHAALGVCGGGGVKLPPRVLYLFIFFSFFVALTEQSIERGSTLNAPQTCFGGQYIPNVSFCFKGQPSPIYAPKPLIGEHLQHKPMESVFAYILTTNKAIITKLHNSNEQLKCYIIVYN